MKDPLTGQEFILIDMMGNEIFVGDPIFFAAMNGLSPTLRLGLVKSIKFYPKQIRVIYDRFSDNEWSTKGDCYFIKTQRQSGLNDNQVVKVQGDIAFYVGEKKFAKLFEAKTIFDKTIGLSQETKNHIREEYEAEFCCQEILEEDEFFVVADMAVRHFLDQNHFDGKEIYDWLKACRETGKWIGD